MKHTIPFFLTAVVILSLLTGCGASGKQASVHAENEEGTVFTVRIANQSAADLYSIAASYSANGKTLGSKVCEHIEGSAEQAVYAFGFVTDELPAVPIDVIRLDVFAAEKAGEDYVGCGSAVIKSPQPGAVYTLALNGEDVTALTLSTTEQGVEVFLPEQTEQSELSADALVGPWHLAEETDPETLCEAFPGAAEFGSGMEILSDGAISWYIGADGAVGMYIIEGSTLTADVTGELDGESYRITLRQPEPEKLTMTFKGFALVWAYGDGGSLRGGD